MLINYVGGYKEAGVKLKEAGNLHWKVSTVGSTNESGFTALPGGHHFIYNSSEYDTIGYWWSANEKKLGSSSEQNMFGSELKMTNSRNEVTTLGGLKWFCNSVRCIKN